MPVTIRGSGQVPVQIVQGTLTVPWAVTVTAGTYYDPGLSATITPTSSSNKVLVMVSVGDFSASSSTDLLMQIQRNGTSVINGSGATVFNAATTLKSNGSDNSIGTLSFSYIDSPSSTSALTYRAMFSGSDTGRGIYLNRRGVDLVFASASTIILMEISG